MSSDGSTAQPHLTQVHPVCRCLVEVLVVDESTFSIVGNIPYCQTSLLRTTFGIERPQ